MQYIYLIREREFIRLGEEVYKIGKTTQTPGQRMASYPKDSEIILFIGVADCHSAERYLIEAFKTLFNHEPSYGAEYFSGNRSEMVEEIVKYASGEMKPTGQPSGAAPKKASKPEPTVKSERAASITHDLDDDCIACGGSGISYWSDGIYGACWECKGV